MATGRRVVISELHDLPDLRELEALFTAVWEGTEPPVNIENLRALAHSGNYVAGARLGNRIVGGLVAWFGRRPAQDFHMHSHILGVLPDTQVRGLGFELKQHQRRWCLERGVKVVEWTTDPLVSRNVYFNLCKLGAQAPEYLVDFYGVMADGINVGEESDRLLIRWHLDSEQAEVAAAGNATEPDVDQLVSGGGEVALSVGPVGGPVENSSSARVLLCQVPEDIVAMRRIDSALARSWRLALRRALGASLAEGYRVTGATRSGWYVVER
jgi:predicted GNAT superfamily acetyltransferase